MMVVTAGEFLLDLVHDSLLLVPLARRGVVAARRGARGGVSRRVVVVPRQLLLYLLFETFLPPPSMPIVFRLLSTQLSHISSF